MKEIYNEVYKRNPNYNNPKETQSELKYKYIESFIKDKNSILDAGCGSGFNLNKMLDDGKKAFGIEISSVCCDTHLQKLPHKCIDIEGYCNKTDNSFDGVICFDVLEHINHDVEDVIKSLTKISNYAIFGIANHSDVQFGIELHPIQENKEWWEKLLTKYYKHVIIVDEIINGKFFIIECG